MKKITGLLTCILLLQHFSASAQSFAINTTGAAANGSAMLDVSSTTKGLLIPRMTKTERNGIVSPATGLLIFQNGPDSIGYYYYTGSNWTWLLSNANSDLFAWKTGGNTGTIDGNHFIGTTDNIPLTIKVNNQKAGRIDHILGNSFFGYQVGNNNSSGLGNAANGHTAFFTNTTGSNNTVMGRQAMYFNTTGSSNTALGYAASINNTVGSNNTTNGFYALYNNVAGSNATAVGYQSMLYANNTSTAFTNHNVALGFESLRGSANPANNTGNWNTALGYQTLWSNTSGYWNTAVGESALYSNTTGVSNTALGETALYNNNTGYSNTAIGRYTLYNNNTGYNNTATGMQALTNNTSGFLNTATGQNALGSNITGNNNIAYGASALGFNSTGVANTAIGNNALQNNITGINATAIGYQAMQNAYNSATAFTNFNVAVGYQSLMGSAIPANNSGNWNTALGYQTLLGNTTGYRNTAVGTHSMYTNTTGYYNTALGNAALYYNVIGNNNTAVGYAALGENTANNNTAVGYTAMYFNIYGLSNTAVGYQALYNNNSGNNNIAIGNYSLSYNVFGSKNTAVGDSSNVNINNLTNATAIGSKSTVNCSNCLVLGSVNGYNGASTSVNVGIGEVTPTSPLNFASTLGDKIALWGNGTNHYGLGIQPNLLQLYTLDGSNDIAFGYGSSAALSENVRFKGNGNVGIGTTAPAYMLTVKKDIDVDNEDANAGTITNALKFGGTGTGEAIGSNRAGGANQWGLDFYTNFTNRMSISTGGYVGIGTTSPVAKLNIAGSETSANGLGVGLQLTNTASTNSWTLRAGAPGTTTPAGGFSIGDNSFYRLVITSTGNVGIGTTAPIYQLELSTNSAAKPTSSTWNITSDERLKTIDGNYIKGLKDVLKLNTIMYHYKKGNVRNLPTDEQGYGFSAQEVQKVFPEAVKTGNDGYLSLDIHPIIVSYINAFKELQQQMDELKKQNEILSKGMEELKKELTTKVNR